MEPTYQPNHIATKEDLENQWSKDEVIRKAARRPHIIRECGYVKIRDLRLGEIFYHDFDNFTHFSTMNKRAVEKFEEDGAIVQCYSKMEDGWIFNVKTKYPLDEMVYVLRGEHVSIW